MPPAISLPPVDKVQVTTLVDNSIDLLLTSTEVVQRYPLSTRWLPQWAARSNAFNQNIPIAEHGYSVAIQVQRGARRANVMYDTGLSKRSLLYNMDALEVRATDIQAVILSHGHPDHSMGLLGLSERLGNQRTPLILHPDAYLERKLVLPNGFELMAPPPKFSDLRQENIEVIEEVGPSMLVDDMVLVSGEVSRTTDFEKGFPIHYAKRNDDWEPDPLIMDDQCAIVNVKDRGLVVITGCGHAGMINILRNAQAMTGIDTIYAVIGGFHLSGGLFEPIIPATINALVEMGPKYVVPGHCTGWSAVYQIATQMPEAFLVPSVGSTYSF